MTSLTQALMHARDHPREIQQHMRKMDTPPETPPETPSHSAPPPQQAIICACPSPQTSLTSTQDKAYFFACPRCRRLQHSTCMTPAPAEDDDDSPVRCNDCHYDELAEQVAADQRRLARLTALVQCKRDMARDFYAGLLWRHYCSLPDPPGTCPEMVRGLTTLHYHDGRMVPVFPAPRRWLAEVQLRVAAMMQDAGEELASRYRVSSPDGLPWSDLSVLVDWRDLAMWMVHHGPYRGNVAKLGVLAEVLGFVSKGHFWKADD